MSEPKVVRVPTRREHLLAYVEAVVADLILSGQLHITDSPDKMLAAVVADARRMLAAEWPAVLAAVAKRVGAGFLQGAKRAYETDPRFEGAREVGRLFKSLADSLGDPPKRR